MVRSNSKKTRVVFLATPAFALPLLKQSCALGTVVALWTQPSRPQGRRKEKLPNALSAFSAAKGIPVYEAERISATDRWQLARLEADLGFIVAFGQLLPASFFSLPRFGMYNLHFSLLPQYRGAAPLQTTLLKAPLEQRNGKAYLRGGITLQKITSELDKGPILAQSELNLAGLTYEAALEKCVKAASPLLERLIMAPESAEKQLVSQAEENASYCYKIKKEQGRLLPVDSCERAVRKFLAYHKWPRLHFYLGETAFQVLEMSLSPLRAEELPAEVRAWSSANTGEEANQQKSCLLPWKRKRLFLVLKDGVLEIKRLQKTGRRALSVAAFLNGERSLVTPSPLLARS